MYNLFHNYYEAVSMQLSQPVAATASLGSGPSGIAVWAIVNSLIMNSVSSLLVEI